MAIFCMYRNHGWRSGCIFCIDILSPNIVFNTEGREVPMDYEVVDRIRTPLPVQNTFLF